MKRERMIAKVKALLAKTTAAGCTEEEAMAAADAAARLMDEHRLEIGEMDDRESFETLAVDTNAANYFVQAGIANAIAEFCGSCAFVSTVKPSRAKTVKFHGLRSDAEFAGWLCQSLTDFILQGMASDLMRQQIRSAQGGTRMDRKAINRFKNAYGYAAGARISVRLREMTRTRRDAVTVAGRTDLVPANKAHVAHKNLEDIEGKIAKGRATSRDAMSAEGWSAGTARGEAAHFGKPISASGVLALPSK